MLLRFKRPPGVGFRDRSGSLAIRSAFGVTSEIVNRSDWFAYREKIKERAISLSNNLSSGAGPSSALPTRAAGTEFATTKLPQH
jgi:hypothetical protein